jgi:hypothetical protein
MAQRGWRKVLPGVDPAGLKQDHALGYVFFFGGQG